MPLTIYSAGCSQLTVHAAYNFTLQAAHNLQCMPLTIYNALHSQFTVHAAHNFTGKINFLGDFYDGLELSFGIIDSYLF